MIPIVQTKFTARGMVLIQRILVPREEGRNERTNRKNHCPQRGNREESVRKKKMSDVRHFNAGPDRSGDRRGHRDKGPNDVTVDESVCACVCIVRPPRYVNAVTLIILSA